jgi:hypothetical protein
MLPPEQAGNLPGQTQGKIAYALARLHVTQRAQDQIDATLRRADGMDLIVRANRGGQRDVELIACQLGFGAVVVDIVVANNIHRRRIAWLTGAQDDAGLKNFQLAANRAYQTQPGIRCFHHHVQQDDRDVFFFRQQFCGFGGAVGMQKSKRLPLYGGVFEGKFGGGMDVDIVIDNEHAPRGLALGGIGFIIFDQGKEIIAHDRAFAQA